MTRTTLIDLNLDEYNHGLRCYSFMVKLERCNGSCGTLNVPSDKICVPNKTEDTSLSVFNMITGINEPKKNKLKEYIMRM